MRHEFRLRGLACIRSLDGARWPVPALSRGGDRGARHLLGRYGKVRSVFVLLVTGVSGAGKSSVARRLSEWGHRAVSLDGDGRLCSWISRDGVRATRPADPDTDWLASHEWTWDPTRLDEIIADALGEGVETLWLCGQATNALNLADRFDACFLLDIDQQTMRHRMTGSQRGNDFGRVGDTLAKALSSHTEFIARWRRHGAATIDATQVLDRVCEDLLVAAGFAALRRSPGTTHHDS